MDSIWTKTAQLPAFEPLREDIKTDVLVIGGGLAGLLCADRLARAGVDYVLAEAEILADWVQGKQNPYACVFDPSRSMLYPQLFLNAAEAAVNLLTPTVPRCPHMGCALKYNRDEHSWDCPCHGSRFAEDGSLVDNPATDDKKW